MFGIGLQVLEGDSDAWALGVGYPEELQQAALTPEGLLIAQGYGEVCRPVRPLRIAVQICIRE